jgi:hypothetical protein
MARLSATRTGSVGQACSSGVEQVTVLGRQREADQLAAPDEALAHHLHDHRDIGADGAVQHRVAAELLGQVHRHRQACVGQHDMLGPDAEHEGAVLGARRRGHGQGQAEPARDIQRHRFAAAVGHAHLEEVHLRAAYETGDEAVDGPVVQRQRRARLLDTAVAQHDDAVGHRHGLDLVVRDVDHRRAEIGMQLGQLDAHLDPQLRIEVRQGLVEQEKPRLAHDGASDRHALALAARKGLGLALQVVLDLQQTGGGLDPLVDHRLVLAGGLQAESHVVVDRHVRVERVGLKHHGDAAPGRGGLVHALAVHPQFARADFLQPGDHAQQRRLAATRRSDEDDELAAPDVQVHAMDHLLGAIALDDPAQRQFSGHGAPAPSESRPRRVASSRTSDGRR